MEIKKNIPNNTITRKLVDLDKDTGNIYETVNIIARRANQISTELKTELTRRRPSRTASRSKFPVTTSVCRSPSSSLPRSSSTARSTIRWLLPTSSRELSSEGKYPAVFPTAGYRR